jgi:hypothetical protein
MDCYIDSDGKNWDSTQDIELIKRIDNVFIKAIWPYIDWSKTPYLAHHQ